jgi:hypothetical protein
VQETGHGLIEVLSNNFPREAEETHEKPQTG